MTYVLLEQERGEETVPEGREARPKRGSLAGGSLWQRLVYQELVRAQAMATGITSPRLYVFLDHNDAPDGSMGLNSGSEIGSASSTTPYVRPVKSMRPIQRVSPRRYAHLTCHSLLRT